jgi:hypothetical protein
MPQFFKPRRRRTKPGPNKNEQKVMRGQESERQARSAGLLRDRFPAAERLQVHLDFFTPQQQLLDQQTRTFSASDVCDFQVPCPGRCGGRGSFDLAGKIKTVIDSRQPRAEGTGVCREQLFAGSADVCGFRLHCKIDVDYSAQ